MTNIHAKPVPAPTVYVDNFSLDLFNDRITAYAIIDGEDKDFSINQGEFEKFCDENDLRSWDYSRPSANDAPDEEESGEFTWPEIYEGRGILTSFLKAYIEFAYEQDNAENLIVSLENVAI